MKKFFVIITILAMAVTLIGCGSIPQKDAFDTVHPELEVVSSPPDVAAAPTQVVIAPSPPAQPAAPVAFERMLIGGILPYEFLTKEECTSAMRSGDFTFYTSVENSNHGKKMPKTCEGSPGVDTKVVEMASETPLCALTDTPSGKRWVIMDRSKPGEKSFFYKKVAGKDPERCAISSCRNAVYEVAYPIAAAKVPDPVVVPVSLPAATPKEETKLVPKPAAKLGEGCFVDKLDQTMCPTRLTWGMAAGCFTIGATAGAIGGGPGGVLPGALSSLAVGIIGWLIAGKPGWWWGCSLGGIGYGYSAYAKAHAAKAAATTTGGTPGVETLPPTGGTPVVETAPVTGGAPMVETLPATGIAPGVATGDLFVGMP